MNVCILLLVVAGVCIWSRKSLGEIFSQVAHTSWKIIVCCIAAALLFYVFEGMIVANMAKKYEKKFRVTEGIICGFTCAFYRMITFGAGTGVAELYYLSKKNIPLAKATGMGMVQYIIQKVMIGIYGIAGYLYLMEKGALDTGKYGHYLLLACVLTVVIISALILVCTWEPVSRWILWLGSKIWKKEKHIGQLQELACNLQILRAESKNLLKERGQLAVILGLNAMKLTCWFVIPYIIYYHAGAFSILRAIGMTAVIYMLTGVLPSAGGMGSTEFSFILIASGFVGGKLAASGMLSYRFATFIVPSVTGGLMVAWERIKTGGL